MPAYDANGKPIPGSGRGYFQNLVAPMPIDPTTGHPYVETGTNVPGQDPFAHSQNDLPTGSQRPPHNAWDTFMEHGGALALIGGLGAIPALTGSGATAGASGLADTGLDAVDAGMTGTEAGTFGMAAPALEGGAQAAGTGAAAGGFGDEMSSVLLDSILNGNGSGAASILAGMGTGGGTGNAIMNFLNSKTGNIALGAGLNLAGGLLMPPDRKPYTGAADPQTNLIELLTKLGNVYNQLQQKSQGGVTLRNAVVPKTKPISVAGIPFEFGGGQGQDPALTDPSLLHYDGLPPLTGTTAPAAVTARRRTTNPTGGG